VESGN